MKGVLILVLLLSWAWGSADVRKTKEEQKKNRLMLLQLLQAELQETRLPIFELFLDSFKPLNPDSGGNLPPGDELPDGSGSIVDGGSEIQNPNGALLPGENSGQQASSGDLNLPTPPEGGGTPDDGLMAEDSSDNSLDTQLEGFGYWAQSDFDFVEHYGKPLAFLLSESGMAHAHLGALIRGSEVTRYTYHSDVVVGEVKSASASLPIAWGESVLGFDFGGGKSGFTEDSYLQIAEQDGSLWRVEGFEGAVGVEAFVGQPLYSTGDVKVESGVLQGNFLGVSAEHVAGDFVLKASEKSASGNFFGTR